MKKLITGVLAMLACFACFTGCNFDFKQPLDSNQQNSSVEETSNPLDDAAAYLEEMYRVSHKETRKDYEVVSEVLGFAITWSVDATTAVTVEQGSGTAMTKIVINKTLEADTAYVLTATLTDAEGNTRTVSFNRKALAALGTVPQIVETAPVEGTAYKYYVYQSTKDLDLYFAGDMDGYYFLTTENYEEAADLYVEYVEGSNTTFNVYFNHAEDGKQYIGVKLSDDGAHDNIVYAATPPSSFVWNAELGTITTHLEVNKQGKAADYYLGNYSTHTTISASMLSYAGGNGNNVGKLVQLVDKSSIPAETKIATVKDTIDVQTTHKVDKEIELKTTNDLYPEVAITWSVEGEGAVLTDNKLALTIPEQAATVTLTATFTCGEATDTKVFTLTLGPSIPTPTTQEEIVNAAYSLAENEELPGDAYTLTGVITKVNTAFSADYNNVTVTIVVGDMTDKAIECFRLKGEGADVIKVGDTITVTGKLKNYNGKVEFDSGCTLDSYVAGEGSGEVETPSEAEEILNALYALADGESLTGEYILTGKITALDSYNNPTIVVEGFEDKPVYCYKLVVDKAIGDTITVKATSMKNYMGTYEFMNCTLVSGGNEGGGEVETTGYSLSFADKAQRTAYSNEQQVWEQNGVKLTNNKASSTNNVADYANPARFYKNSEVIIEFAGMKKIVIESAENYSDKPYCDYLTASLPAGSFTANGTTITIVFETAQDSFTFTCSAGQVRLYSLTVYTASEGGGTVTPPDGGETETTNPTLGTDAYKFFLTQVTNGKTLYIDGGVSDRYLTMTETATEGVDVYAEKVEGGYKFYTLVDNAKQYLNIYFNSNNKISVNYTAETTCVFIYNAETNCWYTNIDGTDYYLGTYNNFDTVSASKTSYITAENTGVSQFPLELIKASDITGGETPDPHEHSYTAVVTAPTCTEKGYTTYTCECNDSYTADEVAALGHTFVDSKCVRCETAYVAPAASSWSLVTELKNGDLVLIGAPAYGKLLSAEKVATYYNKGVDYSIENFDNVTDAEIFTVTVNADGTYTFTSLTGDVIALADSYASLNVTGNHKSWTLTDRGDGTFLIKNTGRNNFLEWYSSKNNWSTHTAGNTAEYYLSFYAKVESAENHVHNHISEVHAATCDKAGYTSYTCACGDTYKVDGEAATGHNYEATVTAPTCTEKGYTTHTCSGCGDNYTDNEVEATGHTFVDGACSICGEVDPDKHEHKYEAVVTAPTCTATGYTTYTCACGDSYTGDETEMLPHVDTNLDITCDYEGCTKRILPEADSKVSLFTANAMIIVSLNSSYYVEGVITEITDAKNGIFIIADEAGDTILIRLPKDADGNAYSSWTTLKVVVGDTVQVYGKPTKNTSTPTTQKAKVEGGVLTVLKHEHNFSEATCTEASVCACLTVNAPALGHINENGDNLCDRCQWNMNLKISNIVVATDTTLANGVLAADQSSWTWSDDNFNVVIAKGTSTFTIYKTAKAYMQLKKLNTLTVENKNGATIKTVTISTTNATQLANLEKALENNNLTFSKDESALTITIEWNSTENLVITHNGTTTAYVSGVEVVYEPKAAAHEHSYTTVVTAPTCTEAGYTTYTCECGDTYKADEVAATGHTYVEGKCACGAEDPDYVAPHEHSYVESVEKAPTCTETGVKKFACSCGDSYTEEIAATGHTYVEGVCSCGVREYALMSITEALAAADNTKVEVSGTVTAINTAWSDSYGNISVTIADAENNQLYVYRLKTKVALGDIITVKGAMATYNDNRQIGAGATATITGHDSSYDYAEMTIPQAIAAADGTNVIVTGTVVKIGTAYSSQYNNISVYIADENGVQLYLYRLTGEVTLNQIITVKGSMATYSGNRQVTGGTFELVGTHTCSAYTEATCTTPATCTVCGVAKDDVLADHVFVNGTCSCGAQEGVATVTASKTIAELITSEGWTSTTTKQTFNLDDVVTVKVNGGSNTGKAYDGDHIRIYATDSPAGTLTISVAEGYELVSVKISAQTGTYAFLYVDGGSTDICNATTVVSGTSVVLNSVKNGSNGKQVRVTAIEVVYKKV